MTTCVVCEQRETPDRGQVCHACPGWLAGMLRDIAQLHAQLPIAVLPVARVGGGRVSGGPVEAAVPLNVDAVDLALPADHRAVTDPYGDQTGHIPVASQLDAIVMDWADQRHHTYPLPTVPALADWLTVNLPWACGHRDDLPDFAVTLRQLRSTLRGVLGLTDRPTYHHGVPCPSCQSLALSRANGEAYIGCAVCGQLLSDEEYREWTTEAAKGAA